MSINHLQLDRRSFTALGAGATAGLLAASKPMFAQDATPAATPGAAEASAFAATELTEIVITASEFTYSASVPGAMGEGWYIITLDNQSGATANVNLGLLPEGTTGGDLSAAGSQVFTGEGGELPEWWSDATFAGGAIAEAAETVSTLAYLVPGRWFMFSTYSGASQSPASFNILTPEELEANYGVAPSATPEASPVAGPAAPEGITAAVTIEVSDDGITASGVPAGGQQVLQVGSTGETAHDLVILQTTEAYDEAGAASLAGAWLRGEETDATVVGGVGALSPDQIAFAEVDVQPGNYVAFSSLVTADGGLQVDNGVLTVFTAQ